MRVLSWDIGIYNLSFCDIEFLENEENNQSSQKKTKSKQKKKLNNNQEITSNQIDFNSKEIPDNNTTLSVKIHDWGIVPLIKKYCDKCGVNAVFRKGDDYFCNKHWKEIEDVNLKEKFIRIGKEKCCGKTKQNKPCSRKPNWLLMEDYFCSTHLSSENEGLATPISNQSKDLNYLSNRIFEMCSHFTEINYDAILFENQPSLKNPTMKSVQIILYSFFHLSYFNKKQPIDLQFISASNKLKVYQGDAFEIKTNNKYTENKKLGILHTSYFLEKIIDENKDWKTYLAKHSKKDDLCDSFLQALYFLKIIKKKSILTQKLL